MGYLLPEETASIKTAISKITQREILRYNNLSRNENNNDQYWTNNNSSNFNRNPRSNIRGNQRQSAWRGFRSTPEGQWLEEITTDQLFIKLTPTSMMNLKIDWIKKPNKQITPVASF